MYIVFGLHFISIFLLFSGTRSIIIPLIAFILNFLFIPANNCKNDCISCIIKKTIYEIEQSLNISNDKFSNNSSDENGNGEADAIGDLFWCINCGCLVDEFDLYCSACGMKLENKDVFLLYRNIDLMKGSDMDDEN